MDMYEILVPTVRNGGKPFRLRHHRVFDAMVRSLAGGLTVLVPSKGQWVSQTGELYAERMIPVRVACTREQMELIADFAARHYDQLAILFYKVSSEVVIKHYPQKKVKK